MKLVIRLGAAIGLVALSACGQTGQDEAADNMDANAGMTADEGMPLGDENSAGTDTLGNQLNQLEETGTDANTAGNAAENDSGNTSNSS